jgi:phytoene synthase
VTPELENAYAACRAIAREQAKNFYYAFVALPSEKRNAICAVYAFMRRADDLSDDESMSRASRRVALDQWLAAWRAALAGGATADPVFVALMDAQRRFAIPETLLEELVAGTAMDLMDVADRGEAAPPVQQSLGQQSPVQQSLGQQFSAHQSPAANESPSAALATYPTFADLYQYCYLVASVVGLVCIRIFGYRDSRAMCARMRNGAGSIFPWRIWNAAASLPRNFYASPMGEI